MKLKHAKKNSGFTLVELLVVIAIIAALAAISSPIIIRQIARSRATQAINNGKDIYVAIREYAFKEGQGVPTDPDGDGTAGANSDAIFEELFDLGYLQDEKPFYVKGVSIVAGTNFQEGDGDLANPLNGTGATADNVYSYVTSNGTAGYNPATAAANSPVLITPASTVGLHTAWVFNPTAFGAQGVVVKVDGSATAFAVNSVDGTIPAAAIGDVVGNDNTGTILTPTAIVLEDPIAGP